MKSDLIPAGTWTLRQRFRRCSWSRLWSAAWETGTETLWPSRAMRSRRLPASPGRRPLPETCLAGAGDLPLLMAMDASKGVSNALTALGLVGQRGKESV